MDDPEMCLVTMYVGAVFSLANYFLLINIVMEKDRHKAQSL